MGGVAVGGIRAIRIDFDSTVQAPMDQMIRIGREFGGGSHSRLEWTYFTLNQDLDSNNIHPQGKSCNSAVITKWSRGSG
jgi:hypothetical protein